MAETVLPAVRSHWITQMVVSSLMIALGLFLLITSTSSLNVGLGGACVVIFGLILVTSVQGLRSPGLILKGDGLIHGRHSFPRADIAGFQPVGTFGKTHVRIHFAPGADLPSGLKPAIMAGRIGFFHPANHIPIKAIATGGKPLETVLTGWLAQSR